MAQRRPHQLPTQVRGSRLAGLWGAGAASLSLCVAVAAPLTTADRVRGDILARHPSPPSAEALADLDVPAMLALLGTSDPWTRFYAPDQVATITADPADLGVSAEVIPASCGLLVQRSDNPDLRLGDCITAVDGVDLGPVAPEERPTLLLGRGRSASVLQVQGEAGVRVVPVRRSWREGPPLTVEHNGDTTLIRLRSFPPGVTDMWHTDPRSRVVVDLRGNPGGELTEAVRFADRFVSDGLIVRTDVRNEGERAYLATASPGDVKVEVTVWVDERTASAAEIVAAALAQHGARVVGRETVGKRSIQTTLYYEDGSAFQLTIGGFSVAPMAFDVSIPPESPESAWWAASR